MKSFEALIPHLHKLRSVPYPTNPHDVDEDRIKSVTIQMEMLPYSLGAMWYAIIQLARAQSQAINEGHPEGQHNRVFVFAPEARHMMSYYIDNFLESAVRCQNGIIPFISITMSLSLPQSMRELYLRLQSRKMMLPPDITKAIKSYWTTFGGTLRAYRDLSQHFAVIASEARMYIVHGQASMHLLLPNNPMEKSITKIKYCDPEIQALPYLLDNFFALLEFAYVVTLQLLKRKPSGKYFCVQHGFVKAPIRMGPNAPVAPHGVPTIEELEAYFDSELERIQQIAPRQAS